MLDKMNEYCEDIKVTLKEKLSKDSPLRKGAEIKYLSAGEIPVYDNKGESYVINPSTLKHDGPIDKSKVYIPLFKIEEFTVAYMEEVENKEESERVPFIVSRLSKIQEKETEIYKDLESKLSEYKCTIFVKNDIDVIPRVSKSFEHEVRFTIYETIGIVVSK